MKRCEGASKDTVDVDGNDDDDDDSGRDGGGEN